MAGLGVLQYKRHNAGKRQRDDALSFFEYSRIITGTLLVEKEKWRKKNAGDKKSFSVER